MSKVKFNSKRAKFDGLSPITGNPSVLSEPDGDSLWSICMETGYFTRDSFENGDFLEEYEATLPEIVLLHKIEDSLGRPWYPSVLSVSDENVLFTVFPSSGEDDSLWYELQKTPIAADGSFNYTNSESVGRVPMLQFEELFNTLYNPEPC